MKEEGGGGEEEEEDDDDDDTKSCYGMWYHVDINILVEPIYQSVWCHIMEDRRHDSHHCENLRSHQDAGYIMEQCLSMLAV